MTIILKAIKSRKLSNAVTDCKEIWHDNASWPY